LTDDYICWLFYFPTPASTLGLMKFADVYTISKLVKKSDERSKPLDGGFDFGLEDLDAIFALDFLEVDKDWLWGDGSG
jgi:hypothetical protein